MAKPSKKPAVPKGPPGLHSLTVLFFDHRSSFLDDETTALAKALGYRSATARYMEVAPEQWTLQMVFRRHHGKPTKVAFTLMNGSERPPIVLIQFLAKEIAIQYRLEMRRQTAPALPEARRAS